MTDDIVIQNRPDGLTEMPARLAEQIVLGGRNKTQAIKAAGYASVTSGFKALKVSHVREYLRTLINEDLQDSAIAAVHTLRDLMTDARSDYVKLEASKDILDCVTRYQATGTKSWQVHTLCLRGEHGSAYQNCARCGHS